MWARSRWAGSAAGLNAAASERFRVDPYPVAGRLADDGVLAFHTALELHGVAQSVLRTLTVYTQADVRPTEFQGVRYQPVKPRASLPAEEALSAHRMVMNRQGLDLRVTDLERTVVDCLDRLELCGGWEEVQRSLTHVRVLDCSAAVAYALQLGKASVAAKLGLFLHARRDDLFVEDADLDRLTAALPASVLRVERHHPGPYRTVPRWRLSIPEAAFDPVWAELS